MAHSHFKIFTTTDDQYAFHLTAANARVILASERYTSRASAEDGVDAVRRNALIPERYDRRRASDGQHYFVLRGGNHEVIGTSEMYTTIDAREDGIASIKKHAPSAPVEV